MRTLFFCSYFSEALCSLRMFAHVIENAISSLVFAHILLSAHHSGEACTRSSMHRLGWIRAVTKFRLPGIINFCLGVPMHISPFSAVGNA
jgi:hypothetical protein